MQLVQFEATRYAAVLTLTLVSEEDDGQVRLLVAPLASISAVVTGLVVLLAGLARLAGWFTQAAGQGLARLASARCRLLARGRALRQQAAALLTLSAILGRAFCWAWLGL